MGFPDYDFDTNIPDSFISSELVLDYLRDYAKHFNLMSFIKLEHEIVRVRPRYEGWEVRELLNIYTYVHMYEYLI